ncbi:PREDICTED: chitinase domain-containing protein 1 [Erythranthe guttata]|uniref:chitinase domain-containing protein 1 n=1 Tax=Erythranthe guttata TaxID=4155 RepID=UPI00064D8BA5|nr:PREDICTED: chitinase domain-containing protein 1 [Erythranthe guttata]|eukprot:XP_012835600.1 PREDICTED: chitinase domain-containing protein 1 [Erythranthe guttata]
MKNRNTNYSDFSKTRHFQKYTTEKAKPEVQRGLPRGCEIEPAEMAKKRERRPESTQRSTIGESSGSKPKPDRKLGTTIAKTSVILSVAALPAIFVIVYRMIYILYFSNTPQLTYVYSRGLVKEEINYRQVLDENLRTSENSSRRNFNNPVLAYITPWNSQGYDMAKKFTNKFTHLSPVWYELKSEGTKLVLNGRHNADKGWISEIRRNGNSQILPRVVLESIPVDLLKKKKQRERAINLIIEECKEMGYDGIVLESWSRWASYGVLHDPDMRDKALQFIVQLGQAMHAIRLEQNISQSLQLVYVIGPPRSDKFEEYDFGPDDLRVLGDDVDGFSLMTYDFSGPQNPGPNAPLKWIHSTLQLLLDSSNGYNPKLAKKIFVGINFYGNDFVVSGGLGGGPIIGREYLSLLEQHKPQMHWEKNSAEHYFLYIDNQNIKHVVFYPSLMSIATRLDEALSWTAGISIWEIGQGLEYFFDIL